MKVKVLRLLSFLLPFLSSATPSSASHHHLLLTLLHLKVIGGHHPHDWCLVEFRLAVEDVVGSVGGDPDCLIDLPLEAAVEASDDGHGEGLLLAVVDKLAMFPQRRVLSLISEAFLVLQPSGKPIPCALTIILSTLSSC